MVLIPEGADSHLDAPRGPRPCGVSPRVRLRRPEDRLRRCGLRYKADLTDAEWALIEPHLSPLTVAGDRGMVVARLARRDLLRAARRVCVASAAAEEHRLSLVCEWRDNGLFEAINPLYRHDRSRARRLRGVADGGRARQPERENHRERRSLGLRQEGEGAQWFDKLTIRARSWSIPTGAG